VNEKRKDWTGGGSTLAPFTTIGGSGQPAYDSYLVRSAFQRAVWHFVKEPNALTGSFTYIDNGTASKTLAQDLVNAANANGSGYTPYAGEWFSVLLFDSDPVVGPNGYLTPSFQPVIMEVDP
jgi:hypothetical protein